MKTVIITLGVLAAVIILGAGTIIILDRTSSKEVVTEVKTTTAEASSPATPAPKPAETAPSAAEPAVATATLSDPAWVAAEEEKENWVLREPGTASDPDCRAEYDGRESYECTIAHMMRDPMGNTIAFLADKASGKFITTSRVSDTWRATAISIDVPSDKDAPQVHELFSAFSGPDDAPRQWQQFWLSNPKLPGVWVLGLKEITPSSKIADAPPPTTPAEAKE